MNKTDQYWLNHLRNWETSGLSQAEYCRRSGISCKSFSSRKSVLKKKLLSASSQEERFIPLKQAEKREIKIKLSNGFELVFDELPEVSWFGKFIKQLGGNNALH